MAFRTKIDFSNNRQVKQNIETLTILSGGTSFGVTFNDLPSGPNLTTTAETGTLTFIASTFSGNSATTIYSWHTDIMELGTSTLSAITPTNSGTTQIVSNAFSATSFTTIDGNTIALAYTGVSYDLYVIAMSDLGGGNYSGTVETEELIFLSANTLDFTGRTIWNDVSGITRTEKLIITDSPQVGYVLGCVDSEGMSGWIPAASGGSGTDVFVTGGTYSSGTAIFTNNTGGTFSVTGFLISGGGGTDVYVTGGTYSSGTAIFTNNTGGTFNVTGFLTSGGTISPITIVNTSNLFSTGLAGTGSGASGVTNSNFFGISTGYQATGATYSNFFGLNSGYQAINATNSNFIGQSAGFQASGASYSNFIGWQAGNGATSANASNFIGANAGYQATSASNANFLGQYSGYLASGANGSNFFGPNAGNNAINASGSNFFGVGTGQNSTGASGSNFFGILAGTSAENAQYSNFFGWGSGYQAINATRSNFMGVNAGYGASGASYSNFFGYQAGSGATSANYSNFIGYHAGNEATSANNSNFLGGYAGSGATSAQYSNFLGSGAGLNATNAFQSNFFGLNAGKNASGASYSNFIGQQAGNGATNANTSNFIGYAAGMNATQANNSNFIGIQAGDGATGASYSTIIGYHAGLTSSGPSIGSNNIIIGTSITLSAGTINSINLGGVLFGKGIYSGTTGSPSVSGETNGRIGIDIVDPTETLDISGNARIRTIGAAASTGALYYTSSGVLTTNTSDIRLKENIQTLTNALGTVKKLRGVTYDWIGDDSPTRIGFIAQEVEDVVPELTFTNNNSPEKYMGVHYENTVALLVEAIKELASGVTTSENTLLHTQTIIAEDNNIDLNYSGTPETAIGGGISILHAMGVDSSATILTDENGNWVTNNDFNPKGLTIPIYTPSTSEDINGNIGNLTRDEDYLYLKTNTGWKRTNLQSF